MCSGVRAVFDNSDLTSKNQMIRMACEEAGVIYLGSGHNSGTGVGLNRLIELADEKELAWLLYFDQDSLLGDGFVSAMKACLNARYAGGPIGVIGSSIRRSGTEVVPCDDPPVEYEVVRYAIASGTLFSVQGAKVCGGFDEDLFLDTVDHEFCLRLRALGWVALRDNGRVLWHEVGTDSRETWGQRSFIISRHPKWRRELMWRNSLIIFRRYFRRFPRDMLKHLMVRTTDTLVCWARYHDSSYVTTAVLGIRAGLSRKSGNVARKYVGILEEGRRDVTISPLSGHLE